MSIPANQIVSVTPSVLSAGGNPLALSGLILTEAAALPTGAPTQFTTADSVSDYFGASSVEAAMAAVYFNGFNNSNMKPSKVYFSRFPNTAVAAFLRGATNTTSLVDLKAIATSTQMTIVVDGTVATCSNAAVSGATSFSDIATALTSAFTGATKPTITYDSTFGAFVATSGTTGANSTIAGGSGVWAVALGLTLAAGATLSQGSALQTPTAHMNTIITFTQNWVSFATVFEPSLADKKLFAAWANASGTRYLYAAWDSDANAHATPGVLNASFGQWLNANSDNGTMAIYADATNGPLHAAFALGTIASIDFTEHNGRITMAFKSQAGLTAVVTDENVAANLLINGYNFYGSYATANDIFTWLYNGQISGQYDFADSYVNAIWLNNQIQLAIMELFANTKSIPYNALGYSLIRAAVQDPIDAALNFGAIRPGVPLSAAQIAEVNAAAGIVIDQTLSNRGWYFQVIPASAQVRGLRQSPPCKLWYMDGGSVQQLNVAAIDIL